MPAPSPEGEGQGLDRLRRKDSGAATVSGRGRALGLRARLRLPRFWRLPSLRTRLFVSFALLVLLALVMAGSVFVALRRGQSDRDTLDRLAAAAPEVSLELRVLAERGASEQQVADYLRQAAHDRGLRILLVDWRDGSVVEDSGTSLRGKRLTLPSPLLLSPAASPRVLYRFWKGTTTETHNLTFLAPVYGRVDREPRGGTGAPIAAQAAAASASPAQLPALTSGGPGSGQIAVLAVSQETLANAWLGLLPGLGWAGLAALALSALMAGLLSRSIARPLLALTHASEELAKGNFDQEVAITRPDELGRLAAAFNAMARETGRSHLQMRALIADVSHDLKTPLTSILGFAQALRDGTATEPAEVQELTGIIFEEADRVFAIVQDLLYLSQLEAGEMLLTLAPVNLGELACRSLRRIEPTLRERDLSVEMDLDSAAGILGDAGKLERILDNLLDNARKYTPTGGTLRVAVKRSDFRDGVVVCVHNTGSYIAAEEAEHIFDRFYRADRSRMATRGSGLGLAIVQQLVSLHGGTIAVESQREHGTTFSVWLPAAPLSALTTADERREPDVPEPSNEPASAPQPARRPARPATQS